MVSADWHTSQTGAEKEADERGTQDEDLFSTGENTGTAAYAADT